MNKIPNSRIWFGMELKNENKKDDICTINYDQIFTEDTYMGYG